MAKTDPCGKCKNQSLRVGGRREFGQCHYGKDLSKAGKRVFNPPPCARRAMAERDTERRKREKLERLIMAMPAMPTVLPMVPMVAVRVSYARSARRAVHSGT